MSTSQSRGLGSPELGLAIRPGSFSDAWVEYCRERSIRFTSLNPHDFDIGAASRGLKALAWHWSHEDRAAAIMARPLIASLEARGLAVFPSTATSWHFDDKLGQSYLLQALDAPIPRFWAFYDLGDALEWVEKASFPVVHKLRGGAGAANVKLVRDARIARWISEKSFGRGFVEVPGYLDDAKTKIRRLSSWSEAVQKARRAPGMLLEARRARRNAARARGYVLFQEFMPHNIQDTRVTVIGNRAFAFTRSNRPGDFRASGSGLLDHRPERIDPRCLEISFAVARKLGAQSLAFDFVLDADKNPRILEISYCYQADAVYACPGFWDSNLTWHHGHMWPQHAIMADLLHGAGIYYDN